MFFYNHSIFKTQGVGYVEFRILLKFMGVTDKRG